MGSKQENPAKPSKAKRITLICLILIVILIAVAYAGMHYTSRPQFCSSCHEIAPQVTSWELGKHNMVTCLDCHASPGGTAYIIRKLSSYKEVYLHVFHHVPTTIVWVPHLDSCLYCHSGKNHSFPNAINITLNPGSAPNAPSISYQTMMSGQTNCISCHTNIGHAH